MPAQRLAGYCLRITPAMVSWAKALLYGILAGIPALIPDR